MSDLSGKDSDLNFVDAENKSLSEKQKEGEESVEKKVEVSADEIVKDEKRVKSKVEILEADPEEDEMPREREMKIHVFDGSDYKIWRKRILLYLQRKEYDGPAKRVRTTENEAA